MKMWPGVVIPPLLSEQEGEFAPIEFAPSALPIQHRPGKRVSPSPTPHYAVGMALVRILVDGYSLLHNWPELAPGKPRHSAFARAELIAILTQYQDATGTPITIFFDGGGSPAGVSKNESTRAVEVLFSKSGKTADDMIERAAHRFQPYGEVLAVTDDHAERDTVIALGGSTASCLNFITMIESALRNLAEDVKQYNHTERNRYKRTG